MNDGSTVDVHVNRSVTPNFPTRGIELRPSSGALVYRMSAVPISNEGNKPALTLTGDNPDDPAEFERVIHGSFDTWDQESPPDIVSFSFVNAADLDEEQTRGVIAPPGPKIAAWGGHLGFPSKGALVSNRAVYAGIKGSPAFLYTSNANAYNNMAQDRAVLRDQDSQRSGSRFLVEQERRGDKDLSTEYSTPNGDRITGVASFHGLVAFTDRATYLLTDGETTAIDAQNTSLDLTYQFDKGISPEFEPVRIGEYLMIYDRNDKDLCLIYQADQRTAGLRYQSIGQLRNDEIFAESPIVKIVRYYGGENRQGVIMLREDGTLLFMAVDLNATSFDDFRMAISRWEFTKGPYTPELSRVHDISSFGDDRVTITLDRENSVVTEELSLDVDRDATLVEALRQQSRVSLTDLPRADGNVPIQTSSTSGEQPEVEAAINADWSQMPPPYPTDKSDLVEPQTGNADGFSNGWKMPKTDSPIDPYYVTLHGFGDGDDSGNTQPNPDIGKGVRGWQFSYRPRVGNNPAGKADVERQLINEDGELAWTLPAAFSTDELAGATTFPDNSRWVFAMNLVIQKSVLDENTYPIFTIQAAADTDLLRFDYDGSQQILVVDEAGIKTPIDTLEVGELGRYSLAIDRVDYVTPVAARRVFSIEAPAPSVPTADDIGKITMVFPELDDDGERKELEVEQKWRVGTEFTAVAASASTGALGTLAPNVLTPETPFTLQIKRRSSHSDPETFADKSWETVLSDLRYTSGRTSYAFTDAANNRYYFEISDETDDLVGGLVRGRLEYERDSKPQYLARILLADGTDYVLEWNTSRRENTVWGDETATTDTTWRDGINTVGALSIVKNIDDYSVTVASPGKKMKTVHLRANIDDIFAAYASARGGVFPPGPFRANRYRATLGITLTDGSEEQEVVVKGIMFGDDLYSGSAPFGTFYGNEVPFKVGDEDMEFAISNVNYFRFLRIRGDFFSAVVKRIEFEMDDDTPADRVSENDIIYRVSIDTSNYLSPEPTDNRNGITDSEITDVKYNPIENEQFLINVGDNSLPVSTDGVTYNYRNDLAGPEILDDRFELTDAFGNQLGDYNVYINNRGGTPVREGIRIRGEYSSLRFVIAGRNYVASSAISDFNTVTRQFGRVGDVVTTAYILRYGEGNARQSDKVTATLRFTRGRVSASIDARAIGVKVDYHNDGITDLTIGDVAATDPNQDAPHYAWTAFKDGREVGAGRFISNNFAVSTAYPNFVFNAPDNGGTLTLSNRLIGYQSPTEAANLPLSEIATFSEQFVGSSWSEFIQSNFEHPFAFEWVVGESDGFQSLLVGEMLVGHGEFGRGTNPIAEDENTTGATLFKTRLFTLKEVGQPDGRETATFQLDSPILNDKSRLIAAPNFENIPANNIAWAVERKTSTLAELTIAMNGQILFQEEVEHGRGQVFPINNIAVFQQSATASYFMREPNFVIIRVSNRGGFDTGRWLSFATGSGDSFYDTIQAGFDGERVIYDGEIPISVRARFLPPWIPDLGASNDYYDLEFNRFALVVTDMLGPPAVLFNGLDISPADTFDGISGDDPKFSGHYGMRARKRLTRRNLTSSREQTYSDGLDVQYTATAGSAVDKIVADVRIASAQS